MVLKLYVMFCSWNQISYILIFTYCSCPVGMLCWSFCYLSSSKTNTWEHLLSSRNSFRCRFSVFFRWWRWIVFTNVRRTRFVCRGRRYIENKNRHPFHGNNPWHGNFWIGHMPVRGSRCIWLPRNNAASFWNFGSFRRLVRRAWWRSVGRKHRSFLGFWQVRCCVSVCCHRWRQSTPRSEVRKGRCVSLWSR